MGKKLRTVGVMLRESAAMALDNIRGNKVRSFLTLLGIMIGVMAVITLITTVSGVSGTITSSFSDMGVGTLTVTVTGSDLKTGVTPEDLAEIAALDSVDGVVPSVSLGGRVSYGKNVQTGFTVSGKNAYYFEQNKEMIVQGRALNFIDDDNHSYVCVISQEIVDEFFFGRDPIGETLYVSHCRTLRGRQRRRNRVDLHGIAGHHHSLYHRPENQQHRRSDQLYGLPEGRHGFRGSPGGNRRRHGRAVRL